MDLIAWARRSSPWIIHFNAGACNGCNIEVLAALTPRFDPERFGVLLQASPRHADVLVVTGAVTLQVEDRLLRMYEQMPEPKSVIAVGSCACSGGVFRGCYSVQDGLEYYLPVGVYVPGCPPKLEAVIDATLKLLKKLAVGQQLRHPGHSRPRACIGRPLAHADLALRGHADRFHGQAGCLWPAHLAAVRPR